MSATKNIIIIIAVVVVVVVVDDVSCEFFTPALTEGLI